MAMILWQCGSIKYFRPVALSLNTFEFPLEKHKSMQSPVRNVERNGPFFTLQKSIRPMLHCANYKNDLFYWFFWFFFGCLAAQSIHVIQNGELYCRVHGIAKVVKCNQINRVKQLLITLQVLYSRFVLFEF